MPVGLAVAASARRGAFQKTLSTTNLAQFLHVFTVSRANHSCMAFEWSDMQNTAREVSAGGRGATRFIEAVMRVARPHRQQLHWVANMPGFSAGKTQTPPLPPAPHCAGAPSQGSPPLPLAGTAAGSSCRHPSAEPQVHARSPWCRMRVASRLDVPATTQHVNRRSGAAHHDSDDACAIPRPRALC